MKKKIFDVAILGTGPVGLFAAFQAGMHEMSAIAFDSHSIPGGQCTILYPQKYIYDIPGHPKILAKSLVENLLESCSKFEINFSFNTEIISIEKIDNFFELKSKNEELFYAKSVIVSTGCGSFNPNKPQIKNLEKFENSHVHFFVKNPEIFRNKTIAIAGGGDSAVDRALNLSTVAKKIYFIHRRNELRCHANSLHELMKLSSGVIDIKIPYVGKEFIGDEKIEKIIIHHFEDKEKIFELEIDHFLAFFGLKGALSDFYKIFEMTSNRIIVNKHMESSISGIYAAGDICSYEGKTKLLVSGFHEASVACNAIDDYLKENFGKKSKSFTFSSSKFSH